MGKKNQRLISEGLHNFAKSRNLEYIEEDNYRNQKTILKWRCKVCGFIFKRSYLSVYNSKKECPKCTHQLPFSRKEVLEWIRKINATLISNKNQYRIKHRVKLKCNFCKRRWDPILETVRKGHGCFYCQRYIKQEICRFYLEKMLNCNLKMAYPTWLGGLQLDGYDEKKAIAFEYQGEQHSNKKHMWYYKGLNKRDNEKKRKCKNKGVKLIIIKHTIFKNQDFYRNLRDYILKECKKQNISVPAPNATIKIRNNLYLDRLLLRCREACRKKGGKLISNYVVDTNTYVDVRCKKGHIFKIKVGNLLHGHFCGKCNGKGKYNTKIAREIFRKNNLLLLDTYKNVDTKMCYKCMKCDNKSMISLWNVIKKHGCNKCSGNKRKTLKEAKKVFKEQGLKLLAKKYTNNRTKMPYICLKCNYKGYKSYDSASRGIGCPKCYSKRKIKNKNL